MVEFFMDGFIKFIIHAVAVTADTRHRDCKTMELCWHFISSVSRLRLSFGIVYLHCNMMLLLNGFIASLSLHSH